MSHGTWTTRVLNPALPGRVVSVAVLVVLLATVSMGREKSSTKLKIEPGAKQMSAEEKAIVAQPDKGIDQAVILLEETSRDDTLAEGYRLKYHLRAKILSNQARSLGDITIPIYDESGKLWSFWGYVIKPDGTVREVGKKGLKKQTVTKGRSGSATALKTALPDIEAGCVIDYGYDISVLDFYGPTPVPLQRAWPMRQVRYRWEPYEGLSAAYVVTRSDDPRVKITTKRGSLLVAAHDMEPVPDEDYAPPKREVAIYFFPYYYDSSKVGAAYWNEASKRTEEQIKKFSGSKRKMKKVIDRMGLSDTMDLQTKLRTAYDWMLENVLNTELMTKDQRAKFRKEIEDSRKKRNEVVANALDVVEKGWANPYQLTLLYTGLARAFGAQAYLIKAVDRTQQYFKPQMFTQNQFDSYFVELILPDAPDRAYFIDPADGMPFGQVAWWLTGLPGFKSTPKGAMQRGVPASRAGQNPIKTKTEIEFIDENEALEVSYERKASGQALLLSRRKLRRMTDKEREKKLLEYCGDSADFEVVEAETGDLAPLNGNYELRCEGEAIITGLDEDIDSYSFGWNGVWIRGLPGLDAGERKLPVIFSYPRVEEDVIHIGVPEGFQTVDPPPAIRHNSPFGNYQLSFSGSPEGYTVRRKFELKALKVEPGQYESLVDYLEKLRRADQTPLVFKKAGGA